MEGHRILAALAVVVAAALGSASPAAAGTVPLRDGRVRTDAPQRGWAYACGPLAARTPRAPVPWIHGGRFDPARKPVVDGAFRWPSASFGMDAVGRTLAFSGNGEPVATQTGGFPLAPHALRGTFPAAPHRRRVAACIDQDDPVGIARNGVPIRAGFDAAGRDAVAYEQQDRCGGRTDADGAYYYRVPRCLARGLVGYARDGFAIFGARRAGAAGPRLDACGGHVHTATVHGMRARAYHYHLTRRFPYTLGCFRAQPSGDWSIGPALVADPLVPAALGAALPAPPVALDAPAAAEPAASPAAPPEPEPGEPKVTADPALFPAFDPDVRDYVTRCTDADPVAVSVDAPDGRRVAVDDGEPRSGSFTASVPLAEGQAFAFTSSTAAGSRTYHVRCLPSGFPGYSVSGEGEQAAWYLTTPTQSPVTPYVAMFDRHGVPVWWLDTGHQAVDFKLLPNGHVLYDEIDAGVYVERTLDGTEVRRVHTVGSWTDGHDALLLGNGNYLLITYRPRQHVDMSAYDGPADGTVLDGEVQEIDDQGAVVWTWSTKDHVALDETGRWMPAVLQKPVNGMYDIVHMNALELRGDELVVSLRHTDAVYSIDRTTGALNWKLGGTTTPERLAFVGDPDAATSFGGQHDPRWQPDGTLTLHDNGTLRNRPPRLVRYAIDTAARTATLVEDVRDEAVPSSPCCGSARRLSGGNWVAGWGYAQSFAELTPEGAAVFRVTWDGSQFAYRTVPVEPGVLTRAALRAAMDAMHPR